MTYNALLIGSVLVLVVLVGLHLISRDLKRREARRLLRQLGEDTDRRVRLARMRAPRLVRDADPLFDGDLGDQGGDPVWPHRNGKPVA